MSLADAAAEVRVRVDPPGDESSVAQASLRGRKQARDIVSNFGSRDGERPPPVRFGVSEQEDRGEGDSQG